MSVVKIRVPLMRLKVEYRTSSARPMTELDRLILLAIRNNVTRVDELKSIFHFPERLLVECVVDLMKLGAVALDVAGGGGFRLTPLGLKTADTGQIPGNEEIESNELFFLRENLTGQVISNWDVRYEDEASDFTLDTGVQRDVPVGMVERLLAHELKKEKQFLYAIDNVVPVRDKICLSVVVEEGKVIGLPGAWKGLADYILQEAGRRSGQPIKIEQAASDVPDASYWTSTYIDPERDILVSHAQHVTVLRQALENADTHVLMLSAHISENSLQALDAPIRAAVGRGVRVDILWGLKEQGGESPRYLKIATDWASKFRKAAHANAHLLSVGSGKIDSDAKVLIWDEPAIGYQAVVGSYNWLFENIANPTSVFGKDISVRISEPKAVAELCTTIAGWAQRAGQDTSSLPLRWHAIGREIMRNASDGEQPANANCRIRVVYNEEHGQLLSQAILHAQRRCLIVSHKINRMAIGDGQNNEGRLGRLQSRAERDDFLLTVQFGKLPQVENWKEKDQERLELLVRQGRGVFTLCEGRHCRVLVFDNTSLVSSYNFLSTTHDTRHIGVLIEGETIADVLWSGLLKK